MDAKSVSGLIQRLQEIVPEYSPSPELLALCQFDRHDLFGNYRRAQIDLLHAAAMDPQHPLAPGNVA